MILESILNVAKNLLHFIFLLLPDVPNLNITLLDSLSTYIDMIFSKTGLLGFFVRIGTIKILVPLIIVVINFEHIYHFALWCIHKLPWSID